MCLIVKPLQVMIFLHEDNCWNGITAEIPLPAPPIRSHSPLLEIPPYRPPPMDLRDQNLQRNQMADFQPPNSYQGQDARFVQLQTTIMGAADYGYLNRDSRITIIFSRNNKIR